MRVVAEYGGYRVVGAMYARTTRGAVCSASAMASAMRTGYWSRGPKRRRRPRRRATASMSTRGASTSRYRRRTTPRRFGLYKILFHTSRLYCTIIFFANTPLLCNILHNINSYCTLPPKFEVCFICVWRCFLFFWDRILDRSRCLKKIRARHGKWGIIANYCAISPSQPPFIAYNIAQYTFPTTPFIAIKYWQYLVRAKCRLQGRASGSVTRWFARWRPSSIRWSRLWRRWHLRAGSPASNLKIFLKQGATRI